MFAYYFVHLCTGSYQYHGTLQTQTYPTTYPSYLGYNVHPLLLSLELPSERSADLSASRARGSCTDADVDPSPGAGASLTLSPSHVWLRARGGLCSKFIFLEKTCIGHKIAHSPRFLSSETNWIAFRQVQ